MRVGEEDGCTASREYFEGEIRRSPGGMRACGWILEYSRCAAGYRFFSTLLIDNHVQGVRPAVRY